MIIYRIRNKETGLYSLGGSYPSFSKKGKIWKSKANLTNHFSHVNKSYYIRYNNCEIISFEVSEIENGKEDVSIYLQKIRDKEELRMKQQKERQEVIQKQQRKEQWEKLNKEFSE